jgi:Domain of Unknown Function (DUF748)
MVPVRTRRLLLWVALPALLLVLLYAALGFFWVPRLIRSGAHDFVSKNYHRELAIGDIRFNPFTLRLDIRDFSLPDADGKPMLSFSHLLVDLTIASVWRLGPDFENILLEQPYARVLLKKDGTLNLADLALPPSPPEPNPKPVRLFIKRFSVQSGNVAFDDEAHPSEFRAEIKPITFDLHNFGTVGKTDGTYALNGVSEAGERFSWSGSLSPLPLSSHGQFEVGDLKAQTIWSYLRDSVHFELPSGVISVSGEYDFTTATNPVGISVDVHDVTVSDLGIRPKGGTEDYVKLARLDVHDTRADVAKHTVTVGNVHLAGANVRAWVSSPGAVNLLELVGQGGTTGSADAKDTGADPAGGGGAPPGMTPDATTSGAQGSQGAAGGPVVAGGTSQQPRGTTSNATTSGAQDSQGTVGGPVIAEGSSQPPGSTPNATPWVISIPDIALDGVKISAEDRQVTPHVSVQLDDLDVHVTGFTTARTTPVAVTMSTKINREGKLDAKADLSPDFATAKAQVDLAGLDLTVLQPYIAQRTAMTLRSGQLSTKLNIERAADGRLAVAGDLDVAKFNTVDNVLKQDFIKFERLQFSGIDYQANVTDPSKPASLHVQKITAHAPYARVIVESDRTVNVAKVLGGPGGAKTAASASGAATSAGGDSAGGVTPATATAPASGSEATAAVLSTPTDESGKSGMAIGMPAPAAGPDTAPSAPTDSSAGTTADRGHSSKSVRARHGKSRGNRSTPVPAGSGSSAMAIAVDSILIEDGAAHYSDFWIQPHFAVGILGLNGSILGLSSDPRARAKVELNGKVDRYAPVHIWGETNPLAATAYTDIKMTFKGVELTSATPYSGHFAGYKIEKGKLSVDIGYKIENRQLVATHKFVIDQLELGDRVESPDAVHLPLKIAIALLKDRNGVIDIDLPVTGSLDDPQFKLGPIIWKAFLNLLGKVATAPFALLGHLFGGGEQMNFIDFQPGSATLDPSEREKLVALAKALKEKEKLELDVPMTYSPDLDRPGLAEVQLDQRLAALKDEQTPGHKHGKSNTAAAAAAHAASPAATTPATSAGAPTSTAPGQGAATAALPPLPQPPPPDPALTDPQQRYHLLATLYRAQMGKDTPLPDTAQAVEAAKKKDPPPDFGAANAELEAALLQKMPVTDSDLELLGKHRARAIEDVLLLGTDIDPSRVFAIGSAPKGAVEKDKVRVELALK